MCLQGDLRSLYHRPLLFSLHLHHRPCISNHSTVFAHHGLDTVFQSGSPRSTRSQESAHFSYKKGCMKYIHCSGPSCLCCVYPTCSNLYEISCRQNVKGMIWLSSNKMFLTKAGDRLDWPMSCGLMSPVARGGLGSKRFIVSERNRGRRGGT